MVISDEDFDNNDFTSEVDNLLPDSNIIILAEKILIHITKY